MLGLNNPVEAIAAQLTLDHLMCFQFAPERGGHADAGGGGARVVGDARMAAPDTPELRRPRSSSSSACGAAP